MLSQFPRNQKSTLFNIFHSSSFFLLCIHTKNEENLKCVENRLCFFWNSKNDRHLFLRFFSLKIEKILIHFCPFRSRQIMTQTHAQPSNLLTPENRLVHVPVTSGACIHEYPVVKAKHWSSIDSPTHSESELEENDIPLSFSPEPEPTTLDLRRAQADQESFAKVCGGHQTLICEEGEKAGELSSSSSNTGALVPLN